MVHRPANDPSANPRTTISIQDKDLRLFIRGILLAIFFGLIFWVGLVVGYLDPN